jgi:hypothetical protein
MRRAISTKWIITILTGGILFALALAGGTWRLSYAETETNPTTPTIPALNSMEPNWVLAGKTTATLVTIKGTGFIPQAGGPWTVVRCTVKGQTSPVWDFTPDTITASQLTFSLPSSMVAVPISYEMTVVNHPASGDTREISTKMPFYVYYGQIFMPIVSN